jgi:hypothetical protein
MTPQPTPLLPRPISAGLDLPTHACRIVSVHRLLASGSNIDAFAYSRADKSCPAVRFPWVRGEECKNFTLQRYLHQGLHLLPVEGFERKEHPNREIQNQRCANWQNGRERPHFFGFQPPKKFHGVAPSRWFRRAKSHTARPLSI